MRCPSTLRDSSDIKPSVYVEKQLSRLEALRDGKRTLVRMPMRAMDSREGSSRRLHIGMLSLCMMEEAALRKVADAAGIQYPTD